MVALCLRFVEPGALRKALLFPSEVISLEDRNGKLLKPFAEKHQIIFYYLFTVGQ
jgi:hypothetical protein